MPALQQLLILYEDKYFSSRTPQEFEAHKTKEVRYTENNNL